MTADSAATARRRLESGRYWPHLWAREESLARRMALAPLLVPEALYRLGAWIHRSSYRVGLCERVRMPARVVAVGNLSVGGSGKTPTAACLALELRARGHRVALLCRGVGGRRSGQVNVVSDGARVLLGPADVGDEPVWLARTLPGVPVLAGRNRAALGLRATSVFAAEILILDDGFQHHRLARDLDLLCVDARLGFGNGHVLPRGPLRESLGALRYTDAVIWTRAPLARAKDPKRRGGPRTLPSRPVETAESELIRRARGRPHFDLRIAPQRWRRLGAAQHQPADAFQGMALGMFTGIARPDRFRADVEALGVRVVALRDFPDHHIYRRSEIESLSPELTWCTTAKDAVKIPTEWAAEREIHVLEEAPEPDDVRKLCDWVIQELDNRPPLP